MFDWPFDFLALLIAIIALLVARKALNQASDLRRRLDTMQSVAAAATAAQQMPPPIPPATEFQQAPPLVAESPPAERPAVAATIATNAEAISASTAPPPLPPPPPPADPGFEERLGTRWVVWIGGLALALGGFFLVRYSIEAGLIGPRVRVMLGGLFALALLASGEWTRRKEDISDIITLPIANIPAILTAAGTAVAFATVYAAYALYGFLAPASAFILLGLVALGTLAAALLHGPALAGLGVVAGFVTPILVSSDQPDYWALYVYLAVITAAAFALARIRLWQWLAITTIVFAILWTLPCLQCGAPMVAPHT